jgi:hypothetical protein
MTRLGMIASKECEQLVASMESKYMYLQSNAATLQPVPLQPPRRAKRTGAAIANDTPTKQESEDLEQKS